MTIPKQRLTFESFDGVSLAGDGWGEPDAHPVLLLHGGGQTRHSWAGTAETLAREGWYAVSLDLRGHGDSDRAPNGNYEYGAFAADTTAVARSFGRPPVLVGASLGGLSSLFSLGQAEQQNAAPLASALVLVDIATRMELDGAQRIIDFMNASPNGFATLEEAASAIASYNPNRSRPADLDGLRKNLRLGEDGRYRWHWDPCFIEGRMGSQSRTELQRLDEIARQLTLPTLLIRGRQSDLLSEDGARVFLEQVPHAHFVDISNAGHMVAGDRNDKFTGAVVDFLREHVRGSL